MNKCINLKHRQRNYKYYLYCTALKKIIQYEDCKNCKFKEYKKKTVVNGSIQFKSVSIKNKSSKLAKLERNRTSLFIDDLTHCIICGKPKDNIHEVFFGKNRLNSIMYNQVIPLCLKHHQEIHKNSELNLYYKQIGQKKFENNHTRDEFIKIFGKNYL